MLRIHPAARAIPADAGDRQFHIFERQFPDLGLFEVEALHRMFQHVRRMGQNRLVIARCAGNGGARVDRRIASRKFAIVQEEDQRVPRFGAADQAKARYQAVSLVCEWRAPQSRPNSLASRRAPACSSRGAAASQATAAPTRSMSIRPRSAASLMSIAAVPGVSTKAPGVMVVTAIPVAARSGAIPAANRSSAAFEARSEAPT